MILTRPENLVRGLSDREHTDAGFDLRVGSVSAWLVGAPSGAVTYIGEDVRELPQPIVQPVTVAPGRFTRDKDNPVNVWWLQPQTQYLVTTVESVEMPSDVVGLVWPRSTLQRAGLVLTTAVVDPGYHGELTFLLTNHTRNGAYLEMNARIAHILFFGADGHGEYKGVYQGGKVTI